MEKAVSKIGFYKTLHRNGEYGGSAYPVERLFLPRASSKWLIRKAGQSIRVLDAGCGQGLFLKDLVGFLLQRDVKVASAQGVDIEKSPSNVFSTLGVPFDFKAQNLDGETLPFSDASFEVISCNHVIEHLFYTEKLIQEFRRILDPDGILIISTPNLAAWMNRILLLLGIQPLGTEVGTESIAYGFRPRRLAETKLAHCRPAGHIRPFTDKALRDLLQSCGFEIGGWWTNDLFPFHPLFKRWGRNMGAVGFPMEGSCRKS